MYQLQTSQSNKKTLTKRTNPSGSIPEPQKKKINITRSARLILPKPFIEHQQQTVFHQPSFQQQNTLQLSQPQQPVFQQNIISFQENEVEHQQYEVDPQLYGLPPTFELEEFENQNDFNQSIVKKNNSQNQDPDEKSGSCNWENNEINILLDYLQENFSSWSKGNKTKFYNDMVKNKLLNKETSAIKSKILF